MRLPRRSRTHLWTWWRWAAIVGSAVSLALILAAGSGALFVIVPGWLIGLALRHDDSSGNLAVLAVVLAIVVLIMMCLIALLMLFAQR